MTRTLTDGRRVVRAEIGRHDAEILVSPGGDYRITSPTRAQRFLERLVRLGWRDPFVPESVAAP